MTMDKPKIIELLKEIEKDIYVNSLESTFLQDSKSCAIHEAIEILQEENCEDAISRQAVLEILDHHTLSRMAEMEINDLPSVNPILKESPESFNKDSETESMLNADLISRRAAKDAICKEWCSCDTKHCLHSSDETYHCDGCDDARIIDKLPSVTPQKNTISYRDCADAMLKMWIDDVLTDGEYSRIMDKLNEHEKQRREEGDTNDRLN